MKQAKTSTQHTALMQAYRAIEDLEAKLKESQKDQNEPIAIVGMGCRFPGGENPNMYWQTLRDGVDMIREHPSERWDVDEFYDPTPGTPGKIYIRRGGYIDAIDEFDPQFFGIVPREVESMDPQQRLVLEVSWEALEDANLPIDKLHSSRTGVYVGVSSTDYAFLAGDLLSVDQYAGLGVDGSTLAGRVSYLFGLQGPSMTVATVCSSSLVSVHLACQALRAGECEQALAGGVYLNLSPHLAIYTCLVQAMAPDGTCKTFDAAANGYGRGEGCGMIALKRLSDALAAGDRIHAVIRGSAVNHDGASGGLTVPSGPAQEAMLRQALASADIEPEAISYLEAHGTGTPLGDPIEVRAAGRVLVGKRSAENPLFIGSVKTNIGHLEAASGVAGLIKTVLALKHQEIPPHLHFQKPNPHIDWAELPMKVPTTRTPWIAMAEDNPRMAGVSSFGLTGTNAHVILSEVLPDQQNQQKGVSNGNQANSVTVSSTALPERPIHLLTMSAKNDTALMALAERYEKMLTDENAPSLADICFTANCGRTDHRHRLAVIGQSSNEVAERLAELRKTGITTGFYQHTLSGHKKRKIVFLFPGQGPQYVDMGRQLYETQPVFRQALELCDTILQPIWNESLLTVLGDSKRLDQTYYTQPALFALKYALVQLWYSWGIEPDLLMGHSVGEYVAACLAGVFSLEDGLKLISARGRLMQTLPPDGTMVAVQCDEKTVAELIAPYSQDVSIAAINGPQSVVISGKIDVTQKICEILAEKGVSTTSLNIALASHSPLMEPILNDFKAAANTVTYHKPKRKLVSNLIGALAGPEIATPNYWVEHIRRPVQFAKGMEILRQQNVDVFIEVSPRPVLLGMGRQCLEAGNQTQDHDVGRTDLSEISWLPSLRSSQPEWQTLLTSLSVLYCQGVPVNWDGFDQLYSREKVTLPTYPFQRQRYWLQNNHALSSTISNREKLLRPLIDRKTQSPLISDIIFETVLDLQTRPFLFDHQVYGEVVFPAAGYISLVFSAVELLTGNASCRLEDIIFREALVIQDAEAPTLQLILTPDTDAFDETNQQQGYTFQIISLDSLAEPQSQQDFALHVSGRINLTTNQPMSLDKSLAEWQSADHQAMPGAEVYANVEQNGSQWGPFFRWLDSAWHWSDPTNDTKQTLGLLHTPLAVHQDAAERFEGPDVLSSGLIDSCFQLVGLDIQQNEHTFVPFAISQIEVYGMCEDSQLWCHTTETGTQRWDLTLIGDEGRVIAKIDGYETIEAQPHSFATKSRWQDWLYKIRWSPADILSLNKEDTGVRTDKWLIFADANHKERGLGKEIVAHLQAQKYECLLVSPGDRYTVTESGMVTINPVDPEDYQRLIREFTSADGQEVLGIYYLWGMEQSSQLTVPEDAYLYCGALLNLVQMLDRSACQARLWLGTRGTQQVDEQTMLQMNGAALWGLGRTIAWEYPELKPVCIDLPLMDTSVNDDVRTLLHEAEAPSHEPQIAYSKGQRYVARLTRQPATELEPLALSPEGSYLITGGLGGLGLKVAQFLAEHGANHIVLTGRSQPSAAAQTCIDQLGQDGVDVVVVQGDISQEGDVKRLLSAMPTALCGIIHAAGILRDGVLAEQSLAQFEQVMAPKIKGAWYLHQFTKEHPLDFFVSFSSGTAVLGSPGQGNYAAANAFLDCLAHYRKSCGLPALSINWGSWDEVGLAASLDSQKRNRIEAQGDRFISVAEGLQVLEVLLQQEEAQVAAMDIDWSLFAQQLLTESAQTFFADLIQPRKQTTKRQSSKQSLRDEINQLDGTARQQRLVSYLQDLVARSLGHSVESIDVKSPLNFLGFDSLMAIDIRTQIKVALNMDLPIVKLLGGTSVVDLAELLDPTTTEEQQIEEATDPAEADLPFEMIEGVL